eukprot:2570708-Pleurochrysis_carterae.AAC.1
MSLYKWAEYKLHEIKISHRAAQLVRVQEMSGRQQSPSALQIVRQIADTFLCRICVQLKYLPYSYTKDPSPSKLY